MIVKKELCAGIDIGYDEREERPKIIQTSNLDDCENFAIKIKTTVKTYSKRWAKILLWTY